MSVSISRAEGAGGVQKLHLPTRCVPHKYCPASPAAVRGGSVQTVRMEDQHAAGRFEVWLLLDLRPLLLCIRHKHLWYMTTIKCFIVFT